MSGITYLRGDATAPSGEGVKMIVHCCNDRGGWGKGFVLALSRRRPAPEAAYRRWYRERAGNDFGPGAVQFVQVEPCLWVANLVGRHGTRTGGEGAPVRYESLDEGLRRVAEKAAGLGASVHMPRIGCGLAGGSWSRGEPLVSERLVGRVTAVTVYDHG
ncbi:macro domain-containing protein [Streptomyces sp. NBC_01754]|uniref:macro domain-containing protein n=1 Tax=Streptomyces sp. NBC_01754 TaxID=2975930 RepID=UPI002DDC1709|nr:macro domain-containing protein [Streptomyces sp. NBC_01754]WSC96082.1 macro domain-containing protein [Streptomyces sp. NBC_01754]